MNAKNKPNGHGALLAKSSGANGSTISLRGMHGAASVDASGLSVANAAAVSTAAAGAEREAYAEVAPVQREGKRPRTAGAASQSHRKKSGKKRKEARTATVERDILPGLEPLPIDGEAFVDAVHAQVDLVHLEVELLSSQDEKVVQRELAYLRELRYGKRAPVEDNQPQIILDMQRPERESS
jgi:hypothetical protein